MKKVILKNGLTVVLVKKPTDSVALMATVKVGSNYEPKPQSGISHFIEHMLFEGTKLRPSARLIANEIESIGGEINAYTSTERTSFYVKVLGRHFDRGLDIITDIIQNPLFDPKTTEKERKIILKEINMVTDEPRYHQWILFQKTLFKKHPARNPTYGTVKAVKSMKRKDLIKHYKQFYKPNNIVLTIVGDIDKKALRKIDEKLKNFKPAKLKKLKKIKEPEQKNPVKSTEKRKVLSSYMVLGYKTPVRITDDSYALDVVRAILGRGQSGKIFDEIRNKRGLAYDVGVHYESAVDYSYFAVHVNTHKDNIKKCVKIILSEIKKLKNLTEEELKEAKDYLEGEFYLQNEDNYQYADQLGFWELVKDSRLMDEYLKKIKKVTKRDVSRVVDKYLGNNYALAIIEQKS
ncbi:insulinase family protein [Candidatus Woesearchaeota archaeon]|nr:insulinase family protein [Candidatus Woesearchaeota archaeon]